MIYFDWRDKLPKHDKLNYATRSINKITTIVIHHFASDSSIESAAAYHVLNKSKGGRGWPAIGYHTVISQDGNVYICNDIRKKAYHSNFKGSKDWNSVSIGIALIGNLQNHNPSSYQLDGLIQYICSIKVALNDIEILGHVETGKNTLCPGKYLLEKIPFIREQVKMRS